MGHAFVFFAQAVRLTVSPVDKVTSLKTLRVVRNLARVRVIGMRTARERHVARRRWRRRRVRMVRFRDYLVSSSHDSSIQSSVVVGWSTSSFLLTLTKPSSASLFATPWFEARNIGFRGEDWVEWGAERSILEGRWE